MVGVTERRVLTRRAFLRLVCLTTTGGALSACGSPQVTQNFDPPFASSSLSTPSLVPLHTPTSTTALTAAAATPNPTATPTPTSTATPTSSSTAEPTTIVTPTTTDTPTPTPTRGPLRVISLIHGPARSLVVDHVLQRFGVLATSIRVDRGDPVPDLRAFDAVIFAGGEYRPDQFELPFFQAERDRILAALDEGVPILGICLGHQLLAYWLGGEVKRGSWEFGWLPVQVLEAGRADPLLVSFGNEFYAFLWHGDQITRLPDEAVLLASTERCPVQAYRLRNRPVWGVQFNPQYDPVVAEGVIRAASTLRSQGYDIEKMVATGYSEYNDVAGQIFGNFLRYVLVGEDARATPSLCATPGAPASYLEPR